MATLTLAAVGSSFAAGAGIEPVADAAAGRSLRNYPHQLADRLGATLVDLTVSGATTANILDTPQQTMDGTVHAPQLAGLPPESDVVTITAGGNDLNFLGSLLYLALVKVRPDSPIVTMLAPAFAEGISLPTEKAADAATAGLVRVVEGVRARAPLARVILVDYLTILDTATSSGDPALFSAEETTRLLTVQSTLRRVFVDAAHRSGAELVLASALSTEHALGSAEPWVQPFQPEPTRMSGSFHPNAAGMTVIAAELERILS